jgi:UV DNA damage repair endonuclease
MKIGYPCINLSLDRKSGRTFRLKSFSEGRFVATVDNNLDCLFDILRFNVSHSIPFFRITADIVPFASSLSQLYGYGVILLPIDLLDMKSVNPVLTSVRIHALYL